MLPFIVAFIFAVGLPLLPSSLHRALHLPTLKFNFLSARDAPEPFFVSSPEPTLLLESSYSEASPDSGGSSQYLVFPDLPGPDCWNDAAAPACMSLTERQDYPQTSIWDIIHAHLLYQIAEAMIIITLSFFAATTFFPRHCLRTFLERLSSSLFIYRQYNSKAALSSFLQDVFSGLHKYWMENSVAKIQAPNSALNTSWLAALDVFVDVAPGEYCERDAFFPSALASVSVLARQDHTHNVPLDKANLCFGRPSSNVSSVCLAQSTKISGQERPRYILGSIFTRSPSHTTSPTVTNETTNHNSVIPDAETSSSLGICQLHPREAPETSANTFSTVSSHFHSSTECLPFISMEDLYNSARRCAAAALLSGSFRGAQEACAFDSANSYSSCGRESLLNFAGTNPDPKSERFQPENNSSSFLRISQGGHRRYKSDSIQVRVANCYLGDTAAPLAPAKVDATSAFWKCALKNGEGELETGINETSGSGSLPGSRTAPHMRKNMPELTSGSPSPVEAAGTGIVITPEGMLVVPASQRSYGRVRPGHALREPLTEKYLPPAARWRTSTWDPQLHEHGSPTSSPPLHDSPLPLTPRGMRQQLYVCHNNSPVSPSDNLRQSSSGPIVEGTPSTIALPLPSIETKLSLVVVEAYERKSPSKTSFSGSVVSTSPMRTMFARTSVPVSNLVTPLRFAGRLLARSAILGLSPIKNATENIKEVVEASQETNSVDRDIQTDQPEERSFTQRASTDAEGVGRRPLQDITGSISVPRLKAIEYRAHPLLATTTGPTPATLKQVADVSLNEVLRMPIPISEGNARDTTSPNSPRKRKPSAEPNAPCDTEVLHFSGIPTLHRRRPRARRSAPHLGQYIYNFNHSAKQQIKPARAVQTPDGLKRRRTRTASARGAENWDFNDFNVSWSTTTVDRNGQIILPAGTGWKGLSSAGTTGQQQRQRQPSAVIV